MKYDTYYVTSTSTWRFSHVRSGQPAASDRFCTGGTDSANSQKPICRTPR
ncbi:hypothetical protein ACVWWT_000396 [Pseudomonas sp. TE6349]